MELDQITFESEWTRVTRVTRSRTYHEQLEEINDIKFRLELTVAERATMEGIELMKAKRNLWASRGGYDWS